MAKILPPIKWAQQNSLVIGYKCGENEKLDDKKKPCPCGIL